MGVGAIIGGVASLGGAILSSRSQSRAASRAAEASQANTDATVGLQRDVYNQNRQDLSPFVTRGNAAGNALNDMLGLGGTTAPAQAQSTFQGYPGGAGIPYGLGDGYIGPGSFINSAGIRDGAGYIESFPDFAQGGRPMFPLNDNPAANTYGTPPINPSVTTGGPATGQSAQDAAFENFRNSTGYQFRINEGMDALNSGFAGSGTLQSGAALQALDDYRQNAASSEFANYANLLSQQQGAGLQAAGAQAGVGVNYANSVGQTNALNAANQANAALVRGQNNPFANALGTIGGYAMGAFG